MAQRGTGRSRSRLVGNAHWLAAAAIGSSAVAISRAVIGVYALQLWWLTLLFVGVVLLAAWLSGAALATAAWMRLRSFWVAYLLGGIGYYFALAETTPWNASVVAGFVAVVRIQLSDLER